MTKKQRKDEYAYNLEKSISEITKKICELLDKAKELGIKVELHCYDALWSLGEASKGDFEGTHEVFHGHIGCVVKNSVQLFNVRDEKNKRVEPIWVYYSKLDIAGMEIVNGKLLIRTHSVSSC